MRHNLVRIAREIHQQIKFFRSQLDFAVAHGNDMSIEINPKMAFFDDTRTALFLRSPP